MTMATETAILAVTNMALARRRHFTSAWNAPRSVNVAAPNITCTAAMCSAKVSTPKIRKITGCEGTPA